MGVSGTLSDLNDFEKDMLNSYNIKHFTKLPSMFGKSKLDWSLINADTYTKIEPNFD